ncbi:tripartite tricarboxylate transporter substrate binding protein [Enterovirga sp.]|jgi:tripartite-type tricarboxylate transporter receptor subunit TctC|uniref:tripartite tricarboxylate transporter substrate binding protein n=1 Tax=Enterovirga sp. TaxID=2026350 RepID=UPI0026323FE6|nr:tripartite tricarboxylate transporter substrate binding protein [Enterovirga sp.]MDB5592533.1 transporter [Enterovirga sp.]
MRLLKLVVGAAFGALVAVTGAHAQDEAAAYPNRAIKIVVPFAAGGTTDVLARLIGQKMTAEWGQPVVIENRGGAGATLGADAVAKSTPDGYTLLMGATHHSIAQSAYAKLPYHIGRDFAPVTVVALVPNMVVVNAKVPAKTIEEFIALAKSKPGELNYGTAGAGTAHHLIGEMFKLKTGTNLVHVPYRGSAPAVTDLMAGQVQVMFDTVTSGLPQVREGNIRALAVTTAKRSSALPDVPALGEKALPGFDVGTWFGILAPAGTPPAIVAKLHRQIAAIVNAPEMKARLLELGSEPVANTPAEMAAQIKQELETFEGIIKQINLVIN